MATIWGYCRASTAKQELTLIAQADAIKKFFEYKYAGHTLAMIEDAATSATVMFEKRPGGSRILNSAKAGDAIVVTKLDRAFRSMRDMSTTMEMCKERGIAIHLLDINVSTDSDIGRLMSGIMSSVADFERCRLITRTKDALAARKQKLLETFKDMKPFDTSVPLGFRNTPYGWGWDMKLNQPVEMPQDYEMGKIVLDTYMRCLAKVKRTAYEDRSARQLARSSDVIDKFRQRKKELFRKKYGEIKATYPEMSSLAAINIAKVAAARESADWEKPKRTSVSLHAGATSARNKAVRFSERMNKSIRMTMLELVAARIKMPEIVKRHRSGRVFGAGAEDYLTKFGCWRAKTVRAYVKNELQRIAVINDTEVVDGAKETTSEGDYANGANLPQGDGEVQQIQDKS